jgi:RNA polymerase sigma-70 factor (ECF subfamily)
MLEDERKLIELSKEGEADAFGLLYDHYFPKIYRFILVRVGRREEAEDLSHQTFLKAWQNLKNYSDKGLPFGSWLYRIARNAIIDYYRRSRTSVSLDFHFEIPENSRMEEKMDASLELEQTIEAIGELKSAEQEVVILRFMEELSVAETAKITGKSEGAIKVTQHRAVNKLKELLRQWKKS